MSLFDEVLEYLLFDDHPRAKEWANNDIIVMKIAKSYEAWLKDHNLPHSYDELVKHVSYCLDTPQYIKMIYPALN